MMTNKKILYFVNDADFFLSHRLPVARAAKREGFQVHVAGPPGENAHKITGAGFTFHPIPITRSGTKPWQELRTILSMYRLVCSIRPQIIHNVAMKAVLYGSLAARFAGAEAVVNALTGLGYVFISKSIKAHILRKCIMTGFGFAFQQKKHRLLLQNYDDPLLFLDAAVVKQEEIVIIRGSGVDMGVFIPTPEPEGDVTITMVSRMLWDKGVEEFVEAASNLRKQGVKARFVLVGDSDPGNPVAVPVSQLEEWASTGIVEWLGRCDDIPGIFAGSHIVCLPSYREGLPKVLIEAAACCRPIITNDVPGCREIVCNDDIGFLVPARDSVALRDKILALIENGELRRAMGRRGREKAVKEFSVEKIVSETLAIYGDLS
ncbi:MAG: glycosyltransferase family 4 protein [Geobacter sp.]|nr:glycosyltransferase family 4 protein [Geobacter sp.]